MEVDVLLVGGGVASARCARMLRRSGFAGSILLVGDEGVPPYNRPPLSKEVLRGASEDLLAAEPPRWYERHAVELATDVAVTRLEPDERLATLADGRTLRFGRCLLATGAAALQLAVPGGDSALMLRTVEDARRIREAAASAPGERVVVVGGGLIGVEVASALAALGLRPTLVERSGSLWAGALGDLLPAWTLARLAAAGISVLLEASVAALEPGSVRVDGRRIPARFVVAGVGVRPRDELAATAGIATARGITVGPDQRTSHPGIWAAGDVARLNGQLTEHWHAAREAGERAALSMLELEVPVPRAPWTFTEVAGVAVDIFGEAGAGDDERWIVEDGLIARTRATRLVQLIVIGGSIPAEDARRLVEEGIGEAQLWDFLRTSTPHPTFDQRPP